MNSSSNKQYFRALTGIRAIAAYLVFWFHFNPFHKGNFAWKLTNETHIGVGIFFVLSGFLITTRYSNHVTLSRAWWRRYMQNRVARIYPLYAIITGLTFTAYAIAPSLDLTGQWLAYRGYDKLIVIGLNLSFLRGFFEKFLFTGIAQGWTLSVEECFYLFAPLTMWLLYKVRMRYLLLVAGAIALMLLGAAIVTITPHPFGFFSSYKFMFLFTLPGRVAEFAIGMALAYSLKNVHTLPSRLSFTWLGVVWILACVVLMAHLRPAGIEGIDGITYIGLLINNIILPIGVSILFAGLIYETTWLQRILASNTMELLGKSSYAFYLVHLGLVSQLFHSSYVIQRIGNLGSILLTFFMACIIAWLLFKFLEEPLQNRLRAK